MSENPNVTPRWQSRGDSSSLGLYRPQFAPYVALQDLITQVIRNPDELLQADPHGYDRVLNHPTVTSEMSTLTAPIVNAECVVEGFGEDVDNMLTAVINDIPMLSNAKEQALFAYITGVRYIEIIWGTRTIGGMTMSVPIDFVPRSHQRFGLDEAGNLWETKDGWIPSATQRNDLVMTRDGKLARVPYGKMIRHAYRDGDGRYGYGHGIGLVLYTYVRAWQAAYSYWLDYNGTYGQPIKFLGLDHEYVRQACAAANITPEDLYQQNLTILQNAISDDGIVTDVRNKFELVSAASVGSPEQFERLLYYTDRLIRLTITGEAFTATSDEQGGGSLAKAQEAAKLRQSRVKRLAIGLQETLYRDVLLPIIKFNATMLGGNENRGRIRITTPRVSEEERISYMLQSPVDVPSEEFYKLTEIRQPSPEEIALGRVFKGKPEPSFPSQFGSEF